MPKRGHEWNDDQPIYRQLMEVMVGRILDSTYPEGQLLPSVRQLASEYQVSPLTAVKVFQELSREDLTEKRRGIGFVVKVGVRDALMRRERKKFLEKEWPELVARIKRMDIDAEDLLKAVPRK